jgi:Type II CAAX prenyl endopeptidase Rce1-like
MEAERMINVKTRLFLILFCLGFAGVLSILLIDLPALASFFPTGSDVPVITPAIKILSLIQPTVLVAVAVLLGVVLAPRVGLAAPAAESLAAGRQWLQDLRVQLIPGVVGGLAGGLSILLTHAVFKPLLTTETIERVARFGSLLPMATRLLYGGLTEEVLIRWGFMTLLVWVTWRLFQKRHAKPTSIVFVFVILFSSFVFGLGHLPIAFVVLPQLTLAVVLFVIVANSAFGVVAGYLYWKHGLESAMIAHVLCHVVLAIGSRVGAYF